MIVKTWNMDDRSRISRLEERTDAHGDGNRDIRIKQKEHDADIKDHEKSINELKGAFKIIKWIMGTFLAGLTAIVELFRK